MRGTSQEAVSLLQLLLPFICDGGKPVTAPVKFNWFTFKSESDNSLIKVLYAKQSLPAVIVGVHKVCYWHDITMIVAAAVSVAMIVLLTYRIAKIYQVKNKYPNTVMGEFDFINTDLKQASFSFLNNLF